MDGPNLECAATAPVSNCVLDAAPRTTTTLTGRLVAAQHDVDVVRAADLLFFAREAYEQKRKRRIRNGIAGACSSPPVAATLARCVAGDDAARRTVHCCRRSRLGHRCVLRPRRGGCKNKEEITAGRRSPAADAEIFSIIIWFCCWLFLIAAGQSGILCGKGKDELSADINSCCGPGSSLRAGYRQQAVAQEACDRADRDWPEVPPGALKPTGRTSGPSTQLRIITPFEPVSSPDAVRIVARTCSG